MTTVLCFLFGHKWTYNYNYLRDDYGDAYQHSIGELKCCRRCGTPNPNYEG